METSESDIDDKSIQVNITKETKIPFRAAKSGKASYFHSLSTQKLYETFSLRDNDGRSVLHVATSAGHSEIVELIAKADSSKELINAKDENGWAPIHFAANNGFLDIVEILVKSGADINLVNDWDRTALHYAVTGGRVETAELLIGLGANVNAQDKVGFAPLHRAAGRGYLDLCQLLIDKGAKVDVLDHAEQTPLVNAVICKQKGVAVYLIEKGAEWFNFDTILEHAPKDVRDSVWETVRRLGMNYDQPLTRPSLNAPPAFQNGGINIIVENGAPNGAPGQAPGPGQGQGQDQGQDQGEGQGQGQGQGEGQVGQGQEVVEGGGGGDVVLEILLDNGEDLIHVSETTRAQCHHLQDFILLDFHIRDLVEQADNPHVPANYDFQLEHNAQNDQGIFKWVPYFYGDVIGETDRIVIY